MKEFYINSINYSFQTGSLTDLQKQSIITLLPKQNKDITSLENWRPISLLNIDYRIATEAIANHVKCVISSLVHNSQTRFIKGRYIGENIRLLFEIIDNAEDDNKPGLIFFSDFEKAFNSINYTFIIYLKPKVTLHFELPNISLLFLILTKFTIAMSCWRPP